MLCRRIVLAAWTQALIFEAVAGEAVACAMNDLIHKISRGSLNVVYFAATDATHMKVLAQVTVIAALRPYAIEFSDQTRPLQYIQVAVDSTKAHAGQSDADALVELGGSRVRRELPELFQDDGALLGHTLHKRN